VSRLRSKTEVYFSPEVSQKLDHLQKEMSEQHGKKVSKNSLINFMVEYFLRLSSEKRELAKTE
jgi:mRNA-degrading endonuclease RelE of RelBE toxin-antitoxin system